MIASQTFYAHGKLLLTAEYAILDGAQGLALPTVFGQSLTVSDADIDNLHWKSFDYDNEMWFEATFNSHDFSLLQTSDIQTGQTLSHILKKAQLLNHNKFDNAPLALPRKQVQTHLTFPRNWGLGTSSTLIYMVAKLFKVDAFQLLKETFGGSGYDIACAGAQSAIVYQIRNGEPTFQNVSFEPLFKDNLYFIFLGKKQNSRDGIARYREKSKSLPPQYFDQISILTHALLKENDLKIFEKQIVEHENLVASVIDLPRVQSLYFADYWGQTKSLGAWGGDFILATSDRDSDVTQSYFMEKGFSTVLPYSKMVLPTHEI